MIRIGSMRGTLGMGDPDGWFSHRAFWFFLLISSALHALVLVRTSPLLRADSFQVIELELQEPSPKRTVLDPPPKGISRRAPALPTPVPVSDLRPVEPEKIPDPLVPPEAVRAARLASPVPVPHVRPVPKPKTKTMARKKRSLPRTASTAVSKSPAVRENFGIPRGVTVSRSTSQSTPGASSAAKERFLALIRARIERCKRYPLVARRRRWEGRVVVRFALRRDGSLASVQVVHGSGIRALDRAAVRAVRKAAPFPEFPADLAAQTLELEVPIVFDLT